MRQFFDAKRQHRDAIVLFRMGDFYEMFYEDAIAASRVLELALTSRAKDASGVAIPMCGVPFHALDTYLGRLVRKGYRVAICDQVEDPRKAKGIVRREVTRVVSPGTFTDASYLDAREPAFLAAIVPAGLASPAWGLAFLDVSTGEFAAAEFDGIGAPAAIAAELAVLRPRELVVAEHAEVDAALTPLASPRITRVEDWSIEPGRARAALCEQLRTTSLAGYGLESAPAAVAAAGSIVAYLRESQRRDLSHVRDISLRVASDALLVDPVTLRHLNVVEGADGGRSGSLLETIDRTVTAMGGRQLRQWLLRPLVALARIQDRLDAVEDFAFRSTERARVRELLKSVHDIERIVARVSLGTAGPRDLVALGQSLAALPRLRAGVSELQAPLVKSLAAEIDDLADIRDAIEKTIVGEPPALARDGGVIRDGVDAELDRLRDISRGGRTAIAAMEDAERARTGIASLKVRYNRVFGYYIEISKSNLGAVPADYTRKQTIAGGERYITPGLKEYEDQVLGADERILEREIELFEALRAQIAGEAPRILDTARAVAALDVLAALAETAALHNYIKPQMHEGDELQATDARHPIVERHVSEAFVPNDVLLSAHGSTARHPHRPEHGRQEHLPAPGRAACRSLRRPDRSCRRASAKLAVVDRIFARVGASDNITRGQSTFMVEMQETAAILHAGVEPQPRDPRRDRPRHGDVRRLESRLGGRRAPRVERSRAAADDLRDALSRADRSRRRLAGRRQRPRRRAGIQGQDRLSAQDRARAVRSQLRHSRRAARRAAAGDRAARGGDTGVARARRACARRPAEPDRRAGVHAAAARAVSGRHRARPGRDAPARARHRSPDAARGADAARRSQTRGRHVTLRRAAAALCLLALAACDDAQTRRRDVIVIATANSPTNLDPAVGLDEASQKIHQLLFSSLLKIDDSLRVVPDLAVRFEATDERTYLAEIPKGVRFHDGREMTSADVAYTFRRFLDPAFVSGRKGAYRNLEAVDAVDRYTTVFRLRTPAVSFPINLVMGIVPEGTGPEAARHPIGSGPYTLSEFVPDDHVTLGAFAGYYGGQPANGALLFRTVPDETMRGLELRKGSVDLVINDLSPDLVAGLEHDGRLNIVTSPGTDYAYLGFNLHDPALADPRVRQAIGYAIDQQAIVSTCAAASRGRRPASCRRCPGRMHPTSSSSRTIPTKARALLDAAGYRDPGTAGRGVRLHLTLKTSTDERYRLQAAVIQEDLRQVGIALDVRSSEFATLMTDVIKGNVQLYTLQFVGVTDPDMLRRTFFSTQTPPDGFNRGHYRNPEVDRLIDAAASAPDERVRRADYQQAQRLIAADVPVISLWYKTNVAVAQPDVQGVALTATADFTFLQHVSKRDTR